MDAVVAFLQPVEDIAAFWAAHAQNGSVFVAHRQGDDPAAMFWFFIAIEIGDDLTL